MKKRIVAVLFMLLLLSCETRKKKEMSSEMREAINKEIAKINDDMSDEEIDTMLSIAKLNYGANEEVGILYFEKLSKYRPEASMYMAEYYYEKKDYDNYVKWQTKAAEEGYLVSMYNLAVYLDDVERLEEAEKWYIRFLEQERGNKDAMQNLALVYGRRGKYKEAEELFKQLDLTEGDGMYYTGMYYKTEKQYDKAEAIYREMIEKGNPDGYFGLGQMYEKELKKRKEAEEFYKKGAELGEMKSAVTLGSKYFDREYWLLSVKYYKIAAEKGNVKAAFNIGLAYKIRKDYKDAKI